MTKKSIAEISVDAIQTVSRIREADSGKVASLADSINKLGLMNPITVRPDYRLIAGLHRLEACKRLGWETIPAIVQDYSTANDDATAELLAELAANLEGFDRLENDPKTDQLWAALADMLRNGAMAIDFFRGATTPAFPEAT